MTEKYLVCGTIAAGDAEEGACVKCEGTVWPTKGSMARVQGEYAVICYHCFLKLKDTELGGWIHRGEMVPARIAARLDDFVMRELLKRSGGG